MKIYTTNTDTHIIYLTESQIFDMLLESASLEDINAKYYANIPSDVFQQIVTTDPTSQPNKMGKYGKWLLSLYQAGNLKLEDLYKASEYLSYFHKFKGKITTKDINQYKTLQQLFAVVKPFMEEPNQASSKSEEIRRIKEDAKKVYEDEDWLVIVPLTQEASCYYGKGTQWCTAATSSNNMFDEYNQRGSLYININKKTHKKYQFHFETNSFMDEHDDHIDIPLAQSIGLSDGLINFYLKKYKNFNDELWLGYGVVRLGDSNLWIDRNEYSDGSFLYKVDFSKHKRIIFADINDLNTFGTFDDYPPLKNRYVLLSNSTYVNLFDIKTKKLVFNEEDLDHFDIINDDYLAVHSNGNLKIYSLNTHEFTKNFENLGYASVRKYPYRVSRYYKNSPILILNFGSRILLLNFITGEFVGHSPYTTSAVTQEYYPHRFIIFSNDDGYVNADIMLYDGFILSLDEFETDADKYWNEHCQST